MNRSQMEKQVSNPAPTDADFKKAAKTAKKKNGGMVEAKYKNGGCVMAGRGVRNTKMG